MDFIFGGINSLLGGLWEIVWFIITAPFSLIILVVGTLVKAIAYLASFEYIGFTMFAIVAIFIFIKVRK